jgi:hypothetical protein
MLFSIQNFEFLFLHFSFKKRLESIQTQTNLIGWYASTFQVGNKTFSAGNATRAN